MKLAFLEKSIIIVCELVLATVFGYTGLIKLLDFQDWATKYNQLDFVHDFHLKWGLYVIPLVEVLTALMFLFEKGKKVAAWSSFFLMLSFTIYIYYKIYVWQESLCPCGGIFSQLTLDKHLQVNIFLLSASTFLILQKEVTKLATKN